MYYLHIYNSEKEEGSIVLPFEDMQPMINFVVDQYQKTIKRLKTNNKKYQKITSTWDKNKYDETLEESIKNFEFEIFCSMEITICYELTPEYNEEKHSEKTKRTEVIHWEIIKNYPLKEKEIVNLMMNPDYEFECNISEEMFSEGVILPGAAHIWFEDIGVEYDLRIEKGVDRSCIYKIKKNENGDGFERDCNIHCSHDVHFEYPDWKAYLESVMCKTLIEMHHLKISFNENDVEDMFSRIIGMRFSTIAMIEKWIFEKLQVTKKSLPNFVLQESEINDEILFGNADVDFVLDGTFGKGVLKKQHYDFSISYLKTNDHQMFITDAHWN